MIGKADLHTHTYYSDGSLSPYELITRACELGITALSITDHDSLEGYYEARDTAEQLGIEVIPGVELSATLGSKDVHILGYLFDPDNASLRSTINFFKDERFGRAERIVEKLHKLDLPLNFDTVLGHARHGAIGRPHIAAALLDEGFTRTYSQAFEQYIGDSGPAFIPKYRISPEDAVDIIANAGGISILAHPGRYITEEELLVLIRAGIDGIETVHPAHDPDLTRYYRGIASSYFLLESGGSDFHGGKRNDYLNFGTFVIRPSAIDAMKKRLFIQ